MQIRRISDASADSGRGKLDRRAEDVQMPPSRGERRHSAERRLPVVDESAASFSDWVKSMVIFLAKKRKRARLKAAK